MENEENAISAEAGEMSDSGTFQAVSGSSRAGSCCADYPIEYSQSEYELTDERAAAIAWSYIVESADARGAAVIERFGFEGALERLSSKDSELEKIAGTRYSVWLRKYADLLRSNGDSWHQCAESRYRSLRKLGARVILPSDDLWPAMLRDLGNRAPYMLWVRGELDMCRAILGKCAYPAVSIVGSRAASNRGVRTAVDFAYELAQSFTIVSGGAFGIDAAAHKGALLAKGSTVIFSAAGVDRVYPVSHGDIYEQIWKGGGLVISEFPLGSAPHAHRFLLRNRLIAAFSRATIVIEAPLRSGALSTARTALEIGRPVGAVPGFIDSPNSAGCHELIRNGGTLIASVDHVRELASPIGVQLGIPLDSGGDFFSPIPSDIGSAGQKVFDAVPKSQPAGMEKISAACGLPIEETRAHLGKLLLLGMVAQRSGKWVKSASLGI